ncbi:hypothetical protein [Streptomyces albireticuli]|uniref:Lipoprotein n=1 Tax=Streptomyces albireticuli TaxID=1940 RepID=A0A2A2DCY3_9ACTN|nr:hypothetical protein [Streptomyces albireticuli]MCD9144453.1 hypothetical protein [Streptomyces albireticuli]MCD9163484.1 hypothetical protein [Streptomyces albireticuli]MCD9193130.1 hypothetical protein [Streptomyces albireticuli]PAU49259.1 hypothetical protein CK936_08785 [Streptomyces albireticuli]
MRSPRTLTVPLGAAALAAALAAAVLLCGCAEPGGLKVSGPAQSPPAATGGPVYVSEGPGKSPLRRPAALPVSETVRLAGLRWRTWGGATAVAVGRVEGAWCGPGCQEGPRRAKVTLSGLVRQDRSAYYSRATVEPGGLPAERSVPGPAGLRDLRLHVPQR